LALPLVQVRAPVLVLVLEVPPQVQEWAQALAQGVAQEVALASPRVSASRVVPLAMAQERAKILEPEPEPESESVQAMASAPKGAQSPAQAWRLDVGARPG
jgi:hypothetical protein